MNCKNCSDTGVVPMGCCSGYMCGCMGMPVMLINCSCGQKAIEDHLKIEEVYGEMVKYLEWRVK